MSVDLSTKDKFVLYMNFEKAGVRGENITCKSTENFRYNVIEDGNEYWLAVERMEVPLQTIPMLPAINAAVILESKAVVGHTIVHNLDLPIFTVHDLLRTLNSLVVDVNGSPVLKFIVDNSGRMRIQYNDWGTYNLRLAPLLADIFDISDQLSSENNNFTFTGASPIFDRIDQAHKIQLEIQGINTASEITSSESRSFIITDFLSPTTYNMSFAIDPNAPGHPVTEGYQLSHTPRQRIVFDATERRYVYIKGNSPLQNITVEAVCIFRDGTRNQIVLAPRSIFSVKIGFYKKNK